MAFILISFLPACLTKIILLVVIFFFIVSYSCEYLNSMSLCFNRKNGFGATLSKNKISRTCFSKITQYPSMEKNGHTTSAITNNMGTIKWAGTYDGYLKKSTISLEEIFNPASSFIVCVCNSLYKYYIL